MKSFLTFYAVGSTSLAELFSQVKQQIRRKAAGSGDVVISPATPPTSIHYFEAYQALRQGRKYIIHHSAWKFDTAGMMTMPSFSP